MAAFLMLDATHDDGTICHKTIVNVSAIIRIDPIGPNHCRLLMQSYQSETIYVAGSLKDVFEMVLSNSLPPMRALGR